MKQQQHQWALSKRFSSYAVDAAIQTAARSCKTLGKLPLGTVIHHPSDACWNGGLTEDDRDDLGVGDRGKALQRRVVAKAAADLQYWKVAHGLAENAAKVQRLTPSTAKRLTVLNLYAYVKTIERLQVTDATAKNLCLARAECQSTTCTPLALAHAHAHYLRRRRAGPSSAARSRARPSRRTLRRSCASLASRRRAPSTPSSASSPRHIGPASATPRARAAARRRRR